MSKTKDSLIAKLEELELRFVEIEKEISELMGQVTESAKPSDMKRGWRGRKTAESKDKPRS